MLSQRFTVALRAGLIQLIAVFVLLSSTAQTASWRISQANGAFHPTDLQHSNDQAVLLANKETSAFKQTDLLHTTELSDNDTSVFGQVASTQLDSWHKVSQFAELADTAAELDAVLSSLWLYSAALVVVPGKQPSDSCRPKSDANQPFLTVLPGQYQEQMSSILPLGPINKAAAAAGHALSQPLLPFRLNVIDFNKSTVCGPWAVHHVPSGNVYLDKRILRNMQDLPFNMASHVGIFAERMFANLAQTFPAARIEGLDASTLGQAFSSAAAVASLTLVSQVPLWFCIGCPIVLGMLFPFAFNFGLGAIADELCTYYNLPADECTQLWYSAFALAMILSFASVIPIVSICRLSQCAKASSPVPNL